MGIDRALLLGLVLVLALLVVVDFSWADSEVDVKGNPVPKGTNNSNEKAVESNLDSDPVRDDKQKEKTMVKEKEKEKEKVGGDQVSKPKEAAISGDAQRNNDSNTRDKESGNGKKGNAGLDVQLQSKTVDGDQNGSTIGEKEPNKQDVKRKDGKNGVWTDPLAERGKEISRGEECDHSNKCLIEESKLVACIRVPGNESPDLSLLIQNNGNVPVTVTILSPDFVHLEKKNIQLQQKENKKVKVSITDRGSDSSIVLKTGTGSCSLDIRDVINHYLGEDSDNPHGGSSTQTIPRSRTHLMFLLACFVALPMLAGSGWLCITLWRKKLSNGSSSKYQRLETALPVSGGGGKAQQPDAHDGDGWDNSWGDDWGEDDEEMPKTPSLPLTPSLSGKGLASRRLSKDGWKD